MSTPTFSLPQPGRTIPAPSWATPAVEGVTETYLASARVALLHGLEGGEVYRNGQNSWSPTGWRPLSAEPLRVADPQRRNTADDTHFDDPVRHHSSWLLAIGDADDLQLLGCLEGPTPRLHADLDVLAGWTENGTEATWVHLRGPEGDVFARYRGLLEARYGARQADPGTVWSSWYSFYENVSRADLDAIAPELPGLGFTVLQIDDGWQRLVGDWTPNAKFATGMRDAADAARQQGLRPGLWLAPFITLPQAETAQANRQMLLRGDDAAPVVAGWNWGSDYFTYDFTRADARDWLATLVGTVVEEWGFDYLKLDFINAGAVRGRRSTDVDREAAYRDAIALIRETAGEDAFLLGSGAPVFPSLGILDAVRTGPDVAPLWDNYATTDPSDATAHNSLRNAVARLWLRGLIGLDPDVVYARRRRNLLSEEQIRLLQDCATASGFRALSDPPAWLEDGERAELRAFLGDLPPVEQVSRFEFRIGDRLVDFGPEMGLSAVAYPM